MGVFLKLKLVSNKPGSDQPNFLMFTQRLLFAGYALLGHVMTKTDVLDEFECQLKCMGNGSCKSFNVHHKSNNTKRICELNNITWQMNPDDFKQKKGSTYFGSVQVSKKYISVVCPLSCWILQALM